MLARLFYLVVCYNPLLLASARGLGCGDSALDAVDSPAATLCVLLDLLVREHRQHKLSLNLRQRFEQLGKILLVVQNFSTLYISKMRAQANAGPAEMPSKTKRHSVTANIFSRSDSSTDFSQQE